MTNSPNTPHPLLAKVEQAVELLGGREATARALGMSDRSLRYLLSGQRQLHTGILEDLAKALIARAETCRRLEREIFPAFAANLPEGIAAPRWDTAHARRRKQEGNG